MKDSGSTWKWVMGILLLALLLPVCVVVVGFLLLMPVRQQMSPSQPDQVMIVATTPEVVVAASPSPLPVSARTQEAGSASAPGDTVPFLTFDPDSPKVFVILAALTALVVFAAAVLAMVIIRGWRRSEDQSEESSLNGENGGARTWVSSARFVLLGFAFWVALSILVILDVWLAVSVYWPFVAIYAAFWLLVGALLLIGRPLRAKLVILGLFFILLLLIRFVGWNSRKQFLVDFTRIKVGMTESQVDQVMDGFMKGYYGGPPDWLREYDYEYNEQGRLVSGWATYRHTDEGWGNSDWGVVTFEDSQVVATQFMPD